ncbi:MAG: hypothetical protein ACI86H_002079 [bacterium]|jgi:hypothetical protein
MDQEIFTVLFSILQKQWRKKTSPEIEGICFYLGLDSFKSHLSREDIVMNLQSVLAEFMTSGYTGGWPKIVNFYTTRSHPEFCRVMTQSLKNFLYRAYRESMAQKTGDFHHKEDEESFLYNKVKDCLHNLIENELIFSNSEVLKTSILFTEPQFENIQPYSPSELKDLCCQILPIERQVYHNAEKKRDPLIDSKNLKNLILQVFCAIQIPLSIQQLFLIIKSKVGILPKEETTFLNDLVSSHDQEDRDYESFISGKEDLPEIEKKEMIKNLILRLERMWSSEDQQLFLLFFHYDKKPKQILEATQDFGKQTTLYEKQKDLIKEFYVLFSSELDDQDQTMENIPELVMVELRDCVFEHLNEQYSVQLKNKYNFNL